MNNILDNLIVVKRSGQRVEFNGLKIAIAVKNAFDSMEKDYDHKKINQIYEQVLDYININYQDRKTINVEEIQDIIESILKQNKYTDIYESFSEYRSKRNISRKSFTKKQQHKFVKAIEKIGLLNTSEEKPSISLRKFGEIISDEYTKSYVMDNKYLRAIEEGKIHVHNFAYFNLGYLSYTNLNIKGLITDNNRFYDIAHILLEAKKEINGEITVDNFDHTITQYILNRFKQNLNDILVKYLNITGYKNLINIKKLTERIQKETTIDINIENYKDIFCNENLLTILNNAYNDTLDSINKSLKKNINTLLTLLNNSSTYSISLGKYTTKEANIINNTILDEIKSLDRLNNLSIIYKINKNTETNILNKLSELIQNNKNIKLNSSDSDYFSNGYRIHENIYSESTSTGRMNVANTSINLTRIALKHKKLNDEFYKELDSLLEFTKNELLFVFESLGNMCKDNYQHIFNGNIFDDEKLDYGQRIRKVIKNGTLNINLIGLKECAYIIDNKAYSNIILTILNYINKKLDEFKIENRLNFTLSSVPEGASREFINIDKTIYGIIDNVTNNNHYENITIFDDNLKLLNNYTKQLNGGNILEISLNKNVSTKKIMEIITNIINDYQGLISFQIGRDNK